MSQIKNCGTTAFTWQPREGQADVQPNQENVSPNTKKVAVQAGLPKDQSKMTSAHALQKRELYSVSLRKQKKDQILNIKRTRNIENLSKGKFLLKKQEANKNAFELSNIAEAREILAQVEKSLQFNIGEPGSYSAADLIQILREIKQVASETQVTQKYEACMQNESIIQILLQLIRRDYSNDQMDLEEMIAFQTQVFATVAVCVADNCFAERLVKEINIHEVMYSFLNKYFLQDGLQILHVVDAKDKTKFQRRMKLLEEVLFSANNCLAQEGQAWFGWKAKIPTLYLNLLQTYTEFDSMINVGRLSDFKAETWHVFAWGLSTLSMVMLSYKKFEDGEYEISEFNLTESYMYHLPFLSFIDKYLFTGIQTIENDCQMIANSPDQALVSNMNKKKKEFMGDCITIIRQCSVKCQDKDIQSVICKEPIEKLAIQQYDVRNNTLALMCITIIGQIVVLGDPATSRRFIDKYEILNKLQWTLLEGTTKARKEVLWVLQSLACEHDTANKIITCEANIISNVILQCKSQCYQIQLEAFQCLSSLVMHAGNVNGKGQKQQPQPQVNKILKGGIIAVIHDELHQTADDYLLQVAILQLLIQIFRTCDGEAAKYIAIYGDDCFDQQQLSHEVCVREQVEELMDEFFTHADQDGPEEDGGVLEQIDQQMGTGFGDAFRI